MANVGDPAMNQEPGLQTWPALRSPRDDSRPIVPVLIQVPTLPPRKRTTKRAAARPHRHPAARRRRLRREVRMAGYTVLMASPLVLASLLLWGGRPTISMASARPSPGGPCEPGTADPAEP